MTPKDKAKELIDKFANAKSEDGYINTNKYRHKQCALIAVDLIIYHTEEDSSNIPLYEYYKEVRKEIEKI